MLPIFSYHILYLRERDLKPTMHHGRLPIAKFSRDHWFWLHLFYDCQLEISWALISRILNWSVWELWVLSTSKYQTYHVSILGNPKLVAILNIWAVMLSFTHAYWQSMVIFVLEHGISSCTLHKNSQDQAQSGHRLQFCCYIHYLSVLKQNQRRVICLTVILEVSLKDIWFFKKLNH